MKCGATANKFIDTQWLRSSRGHSYRAALVGERTFNRFEPEEASQLRPITHGQASVQGEMRGIEGATISEEQVQLARERSGHAGEGSPEQSVMNHKQFGTVCDRLLNDLFPAINGEGDGPYFTGTALKLKAVQ